MSTAPSTPPGQINIERVEEHAGADQGQDAPVESADRQPVEARTRVDVDVGGSRHAKPPCPAFGSRMLQAPIDDAQGVVVQFKSKIRLFGAVMKLTRPHRRVPS
ncbi:hypothetical protein ACVIIZ_007067 [Bradyrhizobium sp. USDA 4523]